MSGTVLLILLHSLSSLLLSSLKLSFWQYNYFLQCFSWKSNLLAIPVNLLKRKPLWSEKTIRIKSKSESNLIRTKNGKDSSLCWHILGVLKAKRREGWKRGRGGWSIINKKMNSWFWALPQIHQNILSTIFQVVHFHPFLCNKVCFFPEFSFSSPPKNQFKKVIFVISKFSAPPKKKCMKSSVSLWAITRWRQSFTIITLHKAEHSSPILFDSF